MLRTGHASAHEIEAWTETTNDLIVRALGSDHQVIKRFNGAGIRFMNVTFGSRDEAAAAYMGDRLPFLDSAIDVVDVLAGETGDSQPRPSEPDPGLAKAVFVVHGSDVVLRETVTRWLEKTLGPGYDVVILHEQASGGRTLIEKFEHYGASATYAVVLLTADDLGGPRSTDDESPDALVERLQPRARQNVVFEMGFFFSGLGRHRVAVLYEGGVELPSDIDGIVYIPADSGGGWKELLRNELRAASLLSG